MSELSEKLTSKKVNQYQVASDEKMNAIFSYCEDYKKYLDDAKTEREAVKTTIEIAKKQGFVEYHFGDQIVEGTSYYYNNRNKNLFLFNLGTNPLEEGVRILASHIDSPRLDLKQVPVYEDSQMCFLKTHYYGGIKKYQWTAIPLALHGIIIKENGEEITVKIGDDLNDPIFYVNDLLPHLSAEQYKRTLAEAIPGESLNILVGGIPLQGEDGDAIKLNVLKILNEKYGIVEDDFISAELCAVPADNARDIGFDRAFIASYGHDDKVCAYTSATAFFDTKSREHTNIVILADKEEIGSEGNTGMQNIALEDLIDEMCRVKGANIAQVRNASRCLSADVNAAYDPNFKEVYEKANSAMISSGTCLSKFTGSRGKSGSNDASAEFVGYVRKIFNENGVPFQFGELGKVDAGGGGTVAKFIAKLNIDTVDIGVPVVSMHAPLEVVSKLDVYATYEAFKAFLK